MTSLRYDRLDELLMRIRVAQLRPSWRGRLIATAESVTTVSVLRMLRAVERREASGKATSVRDVAEYMAVGRSTASRAVANAVAAGLVVKANAAEDQWRCQLELTQPGRSALDEVSEQRRRMVAETASGWADDDLDTLIGLLERLAVGFENQAPA